MKSALVTGGSAGLGRAIVERLLAEGWRVVSVDRAEGAAMPYLERITCDLSDRPAVDALCGRLASAGPFQLAVFNAGVSATGRFEAIPPEAYRRLTTVNAETPMILAADLVRTGHLAGPMCFVSSLSHFTGYPGAAVYAATKDAIAVYAKSVRKPFARRGVSVTLACPGPLRTEHAERHAPAGADAGRRMPPDLAARIILDATFAGRRLVVPGRTNRLAALAGTLLPGTMIRQMRRLILDRLDREVW
ncbi:SDR family NAD(P)-dependent oxidoreductase [Aquibium microcysteis]|uniref:SDR family NAD(P)-dependent oxidoreductase n=1 Tax=Aquibium microcysteis TaxID=675281 RepID=UPI00165CF82F|nr:SDR family NAD(P)-dependent oxidoreductase [Aquibium microcysteis]